MLSSPPDPTRLPGEKSRQSVNFPDARSRRSIRFAGGRRLLNQDGLAVGAPMNRRVELRQSSDNARRARVGTIRRNEPDVAAPLDLDEQGRAVGRNQTRPDPLHAHGPWRSTFDVQPINTHPVPRLDRREENALAVGMKGGPVRESIEDERTDGESGLLAGSRRQENESSVFVAPSRERPLAVW